jgi:hypothetical protein
MTNLYSNIKKVYTAAIYMYKRIKCYTVQIKSLQIG